FQPHQVNGNSMLPNFHDKELVLTDKFFYKKFSEPQRGDVIIIKYPKNEELEYIKRLIGLPGEKIAVRDGKVFIYNPEHPDGFALTEPYIPEDIVVTAKSFIGATPVEIPEESYIVMGDNRPVSSDSREWGFVKYSQIVGKALVRYWPINKTTVIKTPAY
ncbi:MAG: signal peptidase I, partial [bacterium]